MAAGLAACGGGDGDSGSSGSTGQDDLTRNGLARFSAQVKDENGAGLADADVLLPVNNKLYGQKTGADGRYSFNVAAAEFSAIDPVAMIVNKTGYRPKTFYYGTLKAGTTYAIDDTKAGSNVEKLADGEFVPEGGHLLWHLGDAAFGGASNSQLQVAATGLYKGMKVVAVTADMVMKYKKITLTFVARGLDTTRTANCKNRAGVFQVDASNALAYSQEGVPPNSPADGSFGKLSFTFDASTLHPGRDLYAFVNSGTCSDGDKGDDFEFTQTLVKFEAASAPASGAAVGDVATGSGTTAADAIGCARIFHDTYQDGTVTVPATVYAVGPGAASQACQRIQRTWNDYLAMLGSWVARCSSISYSGVVIGSRDYGANPPDWVTLQRSANSAYQQTRRPAPAADAPRRRGTALSSALGAPVRRQSRARKRGTGIVVTPMRPANQVPVDTLFIRLILLPPCAPPENPHRIANSRARIMAITLASQAKDVGSIPIARSTSSRDKPPLPPLR